MVDVGESTADAVSRVRVAVLDDYQRVTREMADWSAVEARASLTVFGDAESDPDRLIDWLSPFDVVCVMRERTPLPRAVLDHLPRLRLIVSTGPRNASIDLDAARKRGIEVVDTKGSLVAPMELTWGLILAAMRAIPSEVDAVRAGGWQHSVGRELRGRTLGILGLGRIGRQVATIAKCFEMDVVTWEPRSNADAARQAGVRAVTRAAFFADSDIISIHLVLVAETRGLVGRTEFASMKPDAWLVNTSRGAIVDEPGLLDALAANSIAGAALDVFETEPLPSDHPFRYLPNVIATPHLGYVSREQYAVFYGDMVAHVARWLDRQPPRSSR